MFITAFHNYAHRSAVPRLGLHEAAATGNLGLVNYALSHGQPINSVLHGVLPLHAACSGGNELVVNLLIENGADVNAPRYVVPPFTPRGPYRPFRLPLRYTTDKNRDTSAPIVGNSGSTPLHFACANGHTHIVLTLLQHGAHPDRADKHGITPEALARETGHNPCAEVIRQWSAEKDQDLRDRDAYSHKHDSVTPENRRRSFNDGTRRHLGVKRSIDHALNLFKSTGSGPSPLNLATPISVSPNDSPSPSPISGHGDYAFFLGPKVESEDPLPPRRPSLPHSQNNQPSTKSGSRSRRPSSAENGLEPDAAQQLSLGAGRTGSKYSLRNLFRKCSAETPAGAESSPQIQHSASSSPPTSKRSPMPTYGSSSPRGFSPSGIRSRLMSEGGASRPYGISAAELHHKLSAESIVLSAEPLPEPFSGTRPGILRGAQ